jgi:hypothetical protein
VLHERVQTHEGNHREKETFHAALRVLFVVKSPRTFNADCTAQRRTPAAWAMSGIDMPPRKSRAHSSPRTERFRDARGTR